MDTGNPKNQGLTSSNRQVLNQVWVLLAGLVELANGRPQGGRRKVASCITVSCLNKHRLLAERKMSRHPCRRRCGFEG